MKRALNQVRGAAAISFAAARVAMSGFVAHGLNEAGKFELAMKNVQIATGASAAQMRQMQRQAITLSGATSQDVTQIAREQAMAASSGLTTDQVTEDRQHDLSGLAACGVCANALGDARRALRWGGT